MGYTKSFKIPSTINVTFEKLSPKTNSYCSNGIQMVSVWVQITILVLCCLLLMKFCMKNLHFDNPINSNSFVECFLRAYIYCIRDGRPPVQCNVSYWRALLTSFLLFFLCIETKRSNWRRDLLQIIAQITSSLDY